MKLGDIFSKLRNNVVTDWVKSPAFASLLNALKGNKDGMVRSTAITGAIVGGILAVFTTKETGTVIWNGVKGAVQWGLIAFVAARLAEPIFGGTPQPAPTPPPPPP